MPILSTPPLPFEVGDTVEFIYPNQGEFRQGAHYTVLDIDRTFVYALEKGYGMFHHKFKLVSPESVEEYMKTFVS